MEGDEGARGGGMVGREGRGRGGTGEQSGAVVAAAAWHLAACVGARRRGGRDACRGARRSFKSGRRAGESTCYGVGCRPANSVGRRERTQSWRCGGSVCSDSERSGGWLLRGRPSLPPCSCYTRRQSLCMSVRARVVVVVVRALRRFANFVSAESLQSGRLNSLNPAAWSNRNVAKNVHAPPPNLPLLSSPQPSRYRLFLPMCPQP